MDEIENLHQKAVEEINKVGGLSKLEELKIKYLGRSGEINKLLQSIKSISNEHKKEYGQKINQLKHQLTDLFDKQHHKLVTQSEKSQTVDVTMPGKQTSKGSLHPITIAIEEISKIFSKIGFIRMSYPEAEWDYLAFDALNMPKTHPARDDFETTFLSGKPHEKYGKMILTPHTSSGQIREMWRLKKPPIRMINIAKCYRPNWDATHTPMFHQFEGMCVDKNINITHLKGALDYFSQSYFGEDTKTRLRPHHFQFTEPSFEVDVTCTACEGTGVVKTQKLDSSPAKLGRNDIACHPECSEGSKKCSICKSGWLELGGTGMVHPNVLKEGNIDPDEFSGWAFGFGIERVIMMKYGIDDIRNYYTGDIRFLRQF